MGRPSRRTPEIEHALLDAIAGGIPLLEHCRRAGIGRQTVYDWMKQPDFAARMADARAMGFDALADQMLEIADDGRNDWMARAAADGGPGQVVYHPESVARSRLRIFTRIRLLDRWYPRRAGAGLGRFRGAPDTVVVPAFASDTALAARLAAILAAADREAAHAEDPDPDDW